MVYSTFPNLAVAKKISVKIIQAKLAACANVMSSPVHSIYHWNEKTMSEREFLVIFKTNRKKLKAMISSLEKIHPYETPAILAYETTMASEGYAGWVEEMTRSP